MRAEIYKDESYDPWSRGKQIVNGMVHGESTQQLLRQFGFEGYQATDMQSQLGELQSFSNRNWDFRVGKERWESGEPEFSEAQSEEVFGQSRNIAGYNLVDSTILEEPVSAISILGGGNDAALRRIQYAKENADRLGITPDLYLLGSARQVTAAERAKTDTFAPGAFTEFDLMNSAVEIVHEIEPYFAEQETSNDDVTDENGLLFLLGVLSSREVVDSKITNEQDPSYWAIRTYDMINFKVRSLLAPQMEGTTRANTADTMTMLKARFGGDLSQRKLAAATHAIYTAFQDIDLLRTIGIPLDAQTSTFGFSAEYTGVERKPHQLLQEINSAINSAVLLEKTLRSLS